MKHIQVEFGKAIQYICISSQDGSSSYCSTVYIQIILGDTINKKTYFLHAVAGTYRLLRLIQELRIFTIANIFHLSLVGRRCNYHVTGDDRAWQAFLKKSS